MMNSRSRFTHSNPGMLTSVFPLVAVGVMTVLGLTQFATTPMWCRFAPHISQPCSLAGPFLTPTKHDLELTVDSHMNTYIQTKWFPAQEFRTILIELATRAGTNVSHKRLLIRADSDLAFGQVRSVLRIFADAGFTNIFLITSEGRWPCHGAT